MVGIVSGNGLGLFNTSQDLLGLASGQTNLGQANGKAYVNAATGNLSVQFLDESLSGTGADLLALRTYNSLGALNDGDADGWRWQGERKVALSGTVNTTGSTVTRTLGDGSQATFTWDGSKYLSTAGSGAHDTLTWNATGSEWVFNQDGLGDTLERYNGTTGWIKSTRDSGGNGFDYTFVGNKLTTVKDVSSGQTLEFAYGTNGKLERVDTRTASGGALTRQVYYTYDASLRLSTVKTDLSPADNLITDANVYTTTYTYSGTSNRIASISQSDGTSASFTYDASNRVATVTDQTGVSTFAYGSLSTTVTNTTGNTSTYTYNAAGQLVSIGNALVNGTIQSSSYTYDASGNVTTAKDGRTNTITYTYDANGNRTKEVDAMGNTITRTFDAVNHLLTESRYSVASATTPGGMETTRYVYDFSMNRLRFIISPEGGVTERRYYPNNQLYQTVQYTAALYTNASTREVDLNTWVGTLDKTKAQLTEFSYDYRGNLSKNTAYATVNSSGVGVLDAATDITEYVYSEYGQLLQAIAVRGATRTTKTTLSSMVYDGMGRQTSVINSGVTLTTTYAGVNITVANSATGLSVVSTTDSAGRLTSVTSTGDSTNRVSKYYYDTAGRLRMSTDPTGARSYLFYDAAGRINAKVNALGAATVYTYDADGRVLTETQHANTTNTSTWFNGTAVTQATLVVGVSGTAGINLAIDAANDRKTTYTYDAAGRLATTTIDGATSITNTYDGASRLVKTTQGSRITKFYYDMDGRQVGVLDAERYLTQYVYDAAGRRTLAVRYGVTQASVAQQTSSSFDSIRTTVNGGARLTTYYFYDAEGRQVGVVNEQGFLTAINYDAALNRRQTVQYLTPVTVSESNTFVILETLAAVKARAGASETTTTNFDSYGRVDNIVTHDGTVSRNVYDTAGRLVRQIQAEGTVDQRASRTRYNAFSEVTGQVSGVGEATLLTAATAAEITTAITTYGTTVQIDGAGRKVTELGPNGQKTFLFYNTAGQLTYTVNALGEVAQTSYNSFGQVSAIRVYTNRITAANLATLTAGGLESNITGKIVADAATDTIASTFYNKLGLVETQTDAENFTTINTYNAYGELNDSVSAIASGVTTKTLIGYDLLGRAINTTRDYGGLAAKTSSVYDGFGRVVNNYDANNQLTATSYTDNGRTITVTDAMSKTNKVELDAFGRTVKSYDGSGNGLFTKYTYNNAARTLTVLSPEGVSIITSRTRTGEILQITDSKGSIKYTYTKDGKVDTVTDAKSVKITDNDYDNSGRLYESRDANGIVTRYSYDAANRVTTRVVDPTGTGTGLNIRTTYTFDGQGRQILVTEGAGTSEATTTKYKYDRKGQIAQILVDPKTINTANDNPNGLDLVTTFTYDGLGQTLTVAKGTLASPSQQKTLYTFDKLGRKTSEVVDPGTGSLNITTQYKYDLQGNLTRVIDANGNSTWFMYNLSNQKTRQIDAMGGVTTYNYDKNAALIQTRQMAIPVSTATLATLNVVPASFALPAEDAANDRRTYTVYDNDNRLKYTLNAKSATEWVVSENIYDLNNNVVELRAYAQTISDATVVTMSAQAANERSTISATDVANELLKTIYSTNLRITKYQYDANNRQIKTILPGYYSPTTGQVTSVQTAGSFQRTIDVTYDNAGRAVANVITTGASLTDRIYQYKTYDSAGREINDVDGLGYVSQKTYDAVGNLRTLTRSAASIGVKTSGYWLNSGIAVQTGRTITYGYDKAGRQTQVKQPATGTTNFVSNATLNAATPVFYSGQSITDISYDALGNRIKQSSTIDNAGTRAETYAYFDKAGRQTWSVDALGYGTFNEYDALGNVKRTTEYNNLATAGTVGSLTAPPTYTASAADRVVESDFDVLGRAKITRRRVNGSLIQVSNKTFNAFGDVIQSWDAQNNLTRLEYNKLGKTTKIIEASRLVAGTGVDVFANQVSATPTTTLEYDAFGQSTKQTRSTTGGLGATASVTHIFDLAGNEIQTIDALNNSTYMEYDITGHIIKQKQAINVTNATADINYNHTIERRFEYDVTGRQTATLDVFNGQKSGQVNVYNGYGEVTEERKVWGASTDATASLMANSLNNTVVSSYVYDGAGRVQYKRGVDGYTYFFYDLLGSVTRAEQRGGSQITTATTRITENYYDKAGNLLVQRLPQYQSTATGALGSASVTMKTPLITQTFDRWGNVLTRKDAAGQTTTATYNQDNQLVSEKGPSVTTLNYNGTTFSGDLVHEIGYDSLGRATTDSYKAYNGATSLGTHTTTNTYNAAGQLTQTLDATAVKQQFAYDASGNRVGTKNGLGQVTVDKFDANNQLTSSGVVRAVQTLTGYTSEQITRQKTVTTTDAYGTTTTTPVTETVLTGYDTNTVTRIKMAPTGPYGSLVAVTETVVVGSTTTTTPVYGYVTTQTGTNAYGQPIYSTVWTQTGTTTTQTPVYETRYVYETITTQTPIYVTRPVYETITVQNPVYAMVDTLFTQSQYRYDQAGRKYGEADAIGTYQYYQYDERGNITVTRNRVGGKKTFTFDELGNKTSENEISTAVQYTYPSDPYGTPVSQTYTITKELNSWIYKSGGDFASYADKMAVSHKTAGLTYAYAYSEFGQLKTESLSGTTVTYDYWENGLQKSIIESSSGSVGSSGYNTAYTTTSSNSSYFYYDVKGNKTAENTATSKTNSAYTVFQPYGGSLSVAANTVSTGSLNTSYQYDVRNRLINVSSPTTTVNIGGTGYATTNLAALSYDYDEWGNRRRISSTYTLQGGSQTSRVEWYGYDNANRVTVEGGMSTGTAAAVYKSGTAYAYDGLGRRVKEEVWTNTNQSTPAYGSSVTTPLSEGYATKTFNYNDLGLVTSITKRTDTRAVGANSSAAYLTTGTATTIETNNYDTRGFKTQTVSQPTNRTSTSVYNLDGTVSSQTTTVTSTGRKETMLTNYSYDTSGNVTSYQYKGYDINSSTNAQTFYNTYSYSYVETYSGRQVGGISVSSSQSGTGKGTTTNTYNSRGRLSSTAITEASVTNSNQTGTSYRNFAYNTSGQIISKMEQKFGASGYKTQNYYYYNGGELANLGAISGVDISPLSAVYAGGSTPGSYMVNSGDTLMGIAQTMFGDANLWYLIADANGLNQGPSDAFDVDDIGRNLRIPNNDKSVGNTSSNFKPYNPSEIIGDLTPNPTILPPPKAKGCNAIAMIIMVVVAVVLTVVTAGAAAMLMAGQAVTLAGAFTAGTTALLGGTAAAVAAGAGTVAAGISASVAIGAAAIGGFVGSVGSQLVGKAMGVVEHFSLRQAVGAGLTAGFSAGAGAYASTLGTGSALTSKTVVDGQKVVTGLNTAGNMARGAASYLGAYASNKVVGLESHFNWTDMAVASVSTGITGKTGNSVSNAIGGIGGEFGVNVVSNFWGSTVSSSLSRLAGRGEKQNWGAMVADAFGNALATELLKWGSKPKVQSPVDKPKESLGDGSSHETMSQKAKDEIASNNKTSNTLLTTGGGKAAENALLAKELVEEQNRASASKQAEADKETVSGITSNEGYSARKVKGDGRWRNSMDGENKGLFKTKPSNYDPIEGYKNPKFENEFGAEIKLFEVASDTTTMNIFGDGDLLTISSSYDISGGIEIKKDSFALKLNAVTTSELQYVKRDFDLGIGKLEVKGRSVVDLGGTAALTLQSDNVDVSAAIKAEAVALQLRTEFKSEKMSFLNDLVTVETSTELAVNAGAIGGSYKAQASYKDGKAVLAVGASASLLFGAKAASAVKVDATKLIKQLPTMITNATQSTVTWVNGKVKEWSN